MSTPSAAATSDVRSAVRSALAVEGGASPTWHWTGAVAADDWIAAVERQRVFQALGSQADVLGLPEDLDARLRRLHGNTRLNAMLVTRELVRLATVLDEAGIPFLTFKGPALAVQTTGDLTARGVGDLDVWVSPESVARTHGVLESHGWMAPDTYPRPGRTWAWRHLVASAYEMPLTGPRSEVDLHWWLDPGRSVLPDFATAAARGVPVTLGGREIPTLSPADAFRHSCFHSSKDDWRWARSLVDVHRLARDRAVWAEVSELSKVEAMTLAVTDRLIGLPDQVPGWARARIARVPERVLARAAHAQDQPLTSEADLKVGAGMRQTLPRYLRAGASPSDVARILYAAAVPAAQVGDIPDERAITGLPRAVGIRLRAATRKARR